MVDDYEKKYGPCDRSEFEGEFVVPPELRNRTNSLNLRALKLHGGFLGLSKSRTFLTLPVRYKQNIHASVPDLSRSVPTTPGSNHKISLAASCDSVLEEPELENEKPSHSKKTSHKNKVTKYFFSDNGVQFRRKSEDLLDDRKKPTKSSNIVGGSAGRAFMSMQPNQFRQNSEPEPRYIPVRAKLSKPPLTSLFDSMKYRHSSKLGEGVTPARSLYSIASSPNESPVKGNVRNSASFTGDLETYATYTIPRVSLNNNNSQNSSLKLELSKSTEGLYENGTDSAA